ncbi:hypothetical protein LTR37_004813 [Vermiconidia calcicola]|uniref:Uncharacterized protein n=1 Tax=Vermiconidia calcicola TaxID=1690605 RepID=A0ACC3NLE8_9PEZI|nr:hypothetical protein LTR37_004813 [Vermiconidia calcicola]
MATVTEAPKCKIILVLKKSRPSDKLMMPMPYQTEKEIAREIQGHAKDCRYYQRTLLGHLRDQDWKSKPVFDDDDDVDSAQPERMKPVNGRCVAEEKTRFSQLHFKKWDDGTDEPEFNERGFWWGKPW